MAITVYFFGSLVDIAGQSKKDFDSMSDTDSLNLLLQKEYPALVATKYFIAVNQQIIKSNRELNNGDIVALMPPFSGG
jgi:molybdopterin converting factor small subunit